MISLEDSDNFEKNLIIKGNKKKEMCIKEDLFSRMLKESFSKEDEIN